MHACSLAFDDKQTVASNEGHIQFVTKAIGIDHDQIGSLVANCQGIADVGNLPEHMALKPTSLHKRQSRRIDEPQLFTMTFEHACFGKLIDKPVERRIMQVHVIESNNQCPAIFRLLRKPIQFGKRFLKNVALHDQRLQQVVRSSIQPRRRRLRFPLKTVSTQVVRQ